MYARLTPILLILIPLVHAQFGFFEQMFGHPEHHEEHHHQQAPSGRSQWAAHSEAVSCSLYLCPDTLQCVSRPVECPCPNEEDIKCVIPDAQDKGDGAVVCTRGDGCAAVERLFRSHTA
ncbi:hypothetical protein BJ138DRAFT_1006350 [Hygrophoropsis aurantiaca]|uniref:Uncharacterized protein n=1 Tax=Hygrophoropsis aurantiaca TaxID=72124 RepID=A0ACB8AEP9_9AGAM|nr:hypothetical protein BJ138DRAFT_1006350 [Hygrophoropsis aurantiaca]